MSVQTESIAIQNAPCETREDFEQDHDAGSFTRGAQRIAVDNVTIPAPQALPDEIPYVADWVI